jgi:hypothetical protein
MSLDKQALFEKDELTGAEETWLRSNNLFEAWEAAGEEQALAKADTSVTVRRGQQASESDGATQDDYGSMAYHELQAELKARDLNASGKQEDLVARLREDDAGGD